MTTASSLAGKLYAKEAFSTSDSACALACVTGGLASAESACSRNALEVEVWVHSGVGARVVGAELEVLSLVGGQEEGWLRLAGAPDANLEMHYHIRRESSAVAQG